MRRYAAPALLLIAAVAAEPSLARGGAQEAPRAEAARIERRLGEIEARVLRGDAELQAMNEALGAELLAAMEEISPGVADDARRLAALRAGAAGAPDAAGADDERRMEARIDAARTAAMGRDRLATMVEAFHHLLRDRMVQAEPETEALLRRYGELHRITAAAEP